MTDQPTPDAPVPAADQWLTSPETYRAVPGTEPSATPEATAGAAAGGSPAKGRPRWVPWAAGAGLVAVGVLAGGGVALALGGDDDHGRDGAFPAVGQPGLPAPGLPGPGLPGERDDDRDGAFQQPGGIVGEQRLSGTLTAVTSDSLTLRVSGSETTYALTSASQVVVDGQPATVSDLSKGDAVLMHVIPGANGDFVVERVFAGDLSGIPQPPTGSTGSNA